jgi:AcrR family transcriptional regulator
MTPVRRPSSPGLPRGRHALGSDEAAAAHRARLHEAVIKLLGTQGYGGTSVDELATAAGVSTATLYGLFAGKQELVLDTFDAIVGDAGGRLRVRGGWAQSQGDVRQALSDVLSAVVDVVLRQPEAARLTLVDITALGPSGLQRRRALTDGLQALLRRAATTGDGLTVLSEPALGVLAGGTLHVLDRHLRSGRMRPLRSAALDLATWGAMYETDDPQPAPARRPAPASQGAPTHAPLSPGLPHGRHGLPAAFVHRHQRERILEAVLALSAEQGFEVTSARELATRAGLSRQTFYQHFPTKDDAWSAAFDQAFLELFSAAWHAGAAQPDAEAKVTAAVTACLEQLIAEPGRARLLLVDAASAGSAGSAAIDRATQAFARLIAGAAGKRELPAIVPLAMVGGIVNLVGGWVVEDRTADLADLTPALVEILFVPLFGPASARAANRRLGVSAPAAATEHADDDELRLMDAFARAVVADGLAATHLSDVAQREDIELDTVHELFDDELDCATQALDVWTGQLVAAAAGAYLSAVLDRPLAAHRALDAVLTHVARTPALSALAVSDEPELVTVMVKLRARYTSLFMELVGGQLPTTDERTPQLPALLEVVLEGILAVVARYAQQERLDELPGELTAISLQSLTPFFGEAEAQRVAEQTAALR